MVGKLIRHHPHQVNKVSNNNETEGRHVPPATPQRRAHHLCRMLGQNAYPCSNHEETSDAQ